MITTILIIVLLVNLLEVLYLLTKCWHLKKNDAPHKEYKKMIDKVAPILSWTMIISVILLVGTFIVD
jgi:heme/copper-type cytochrome/quinol oxidase subunit 2